MASNSMSVLVTGGSGKLGRFVVACLQESGWRVISADRVPHPDSAVTQVLVDLRDSEQVLDLVTGVNERIDRLDAVVHLAAIPAPGLATDLATFDNNFGSTMNVFTAVKNAGIKKVVFASSETVLGLPFDTPPPYVPLDEEYRPRPESFYALAKFLEEQAAMELCRWDPELSMIALRFSNVIDPKDYPDFENFQSDAWARKWNLWAYIDARDGAHAVERALRCGLTGFEAFIIASPDSVMRTPNDGLLAQVFPGIARRREVSAHDTLLSIDKARSLLGYEPEHSWRHTIS
jgi:nucleoside-diphosphate-sugar epimerase